MRNGDGSWTFKRDARLTVGFDTSGRLASLTDLHGYTTTVTYPATSSMVVTDPAGRALSFALTGGRISSVTDSLGRTVRYGYDAAGDLVEVIDLAGGRWTFTYDSGHRMITMRSPRFDGDATTAPPPVVTNSYDSSGRVISQADELGRRTSFDYTSIPNATKITDPQGNVSVDVFAYGFLVSETRGYGTAQAATTSRRYSPTTMGLLAETDPNGRVRAYAYDRAGNRISSVDGLGRRSSATFNGFNEPLTRTDARGVTTSFTYTASGDLSSSSTPLLDAGGAPVLDGAGVPVVAATRWLYDDAAHPGDATRVIDPNGNTWRSTFTAAGYLSSSTDPLGNVTSYCTNSVGWRTAVVSPAATAAGTTCAAVPTVPAPPAPPPLPPAHVTAYAFDVFGRALRSVDSAGQGTITSYDPDGNVASRTDAAGNTTSFVYDPAGQAVQTRRADGSVTRTAYWADGAVKSQTDAAGSVTSYAYDPLGRLASVTTPATPVCPSGCTTAFGYDGAGNRTSVTDALGQVTRNVFDAANELVSVDYSDPATPDVVSIGYDATGRRVSMTDGASGSSSWSFDSLGRLTSSATPAGGVTAYGLPP